MNAETPPPPSESAPAPSARTLAVAAAIALAGAAVILTTIVLPAEYGIDPLGIGRATGLINLAQASPPPIVASSAGPVRPQPTGYRTDARQFGLLPFGGYVEYKYELAAGATMLYEWSATADVNFDFHTEPAGKPSSASDSFERGTAREGHGSYTAPYDGIHGWFFENAGDAPVTVTVRTTGFYSAATEFRDDGTRRDHEVVTPAPPTFPIE